MDIYLNIQDSSLPPPPSEQHYILVIRAVA